MVTKSRRNQPAIKCPYKLFVVELRMSTGMYVRGQTQVASNLQQLSHKRFFHCDALHIRTLAPKPSTYHMPLEPLLSPHAAEKLTEVLSFYVYYHIAVFCLNSYCSSYSEHSLYCQQIWLVPTAVFPLPRNHCNSPAGLLAHVNSPQRPSKYWE